jgi:hypothetical protein
MQNQQHVYAAILAYENMYRQTKIAYRYLHSDSKTTNSEVDWHENNSLLYHSGPPADRELFKELFSCQSTSEFVVLLSECRYFTIVLSSHKTEVAAKEMAYENMYRQTKIAYRYLHSDRSLPFRTASRSRAFQGIIFVPINLGICGFAIRMPNITLWSVYCLPLLEWRYIDAVTGLLVPRDLNSN